MKIYRLTLTIFRRLGEITALEKSGEVSEDKARVLRHEVWGEVGYDVHTAFVIAAQSEHVARRIAFLKSEADGPRRVSDRWLDKGLSSCEVVGEASPDFVKVEDGRKLAGKIVLKSYRNG